jgi:hypothetical protein
LLEQLFRNEHHKKMADTAHTAEWEERLAADPAAFEKEIAGCVSLCVKAGAGRAAFQREPVGSCPLCKKPAFETNAGYGCSGYKGDPGCPFEASFRVTLSALREKSLRKPWRLIIKAFS